MTANLDAIYRYPVKGLSPEKLLRVKLTPGATLPYDRAYAIENGDSGFDAANPVWKAKTHYLMLMRHERLAALRTHFDDASRVLSIRDDAGRTVKGDLSTADGRATIETYFEKHFPRELRGRPKVLDGQGYSFSDVSKKVVSIINMGSVAAIENMVGAAVDPLRFRGNLHVSGWPAWHEFDLIGQTLAIGGARLRITKRIMRCAAINVDPVTAARDMDIPHTLMRRLDHMDCGVYAEVTTGVDIAAGTDVSVEQPALI